MKQIDINFWVVYKTKIFGTVVYRRLKIVENSFWTGREKGKNRPFYAPNNFSNFARVEQIIRLYREIDAMCTQAELQIVLNTLKKAKLDCGNGKWDSAKVRGVSFYFVKNRKIFWEQL